MAIRINLTAGNAGAGVNVNGYLKSHFQGFTPFEMPIFLPAAEDRATQILHLDTPEDGKEVDTRVVLLEGSDFFYTFSNHSVSGTIDTIRLGTLGAAWDDGTQDLALDNGLVGEMGARITISGLGIENAEGVKGEVHEIVAGMMGGGLDGLVADGAPIVDQVFGQAHDLRATGGDDRWAGTKFDDVARGFGGKDVLNGKGGDDKLFGGNQRDKLIGGAGDDTLIGGGGPDLLKGAKGSDILKGGAGSDKLVGGPGSDVLVGGQGSDTFVFAKAGHARGDKIRDFRDGQGDVIDLSGIDANENRRGDQDFSLIGDADFSGSAGELRLTTNGSKTFVTGDTDGDDSQDFRIVLIGSYDLGADDFLL